MNAELETLLGSRYPQLFPGQPSIACGDGWFALLDTLCAQICRHATGELPQAAQVKEKYGTLRFYLERYDELAEHYIDAADFLSGVICDHCGAPGWTLGSVWVATRCDAHAHERLRDDSRASSVDELLGRYVLKRVPRPKKPGYLHLAIALDQMLERTPAVVDALDETDGLRIVWRDAPHGKHQQVAACIDLVEAYARRCDPRTGQPKE